MNTYVRPELKAVARVILSSERKEPLYKQLGICNDTFRTRVKHLLDLTGMDNRTQLVKFLLSHYDWLMAIYEVTP